MSDPSKTESSSTRSTVPPHQDQRFEKIVLRNDLLSPETLGEARTRWNKQCRNGSTQSFPEMLVAEGHITTKQAAAISKRLVRQIAGYVLLDKIGVGGMGAVYRAEQKSLDKVVALKILPAKLAADEDFIKRFEREAQSLAKLNHPHIVQAIDFGKDKGLYYISMEYVPGQSLLDLMKRENKLSEIRALEIALQIAMALEHACEHGVIHRDIKPENILLTEEGDAKITDFGLAKEPEAGNNAFRTTAGLTFGTPHYMSPEQAEGLPDLDTRSDIYSLGATLYHMLTGKTPFRGDSDAEIMTMHLDAEPDDPRLYCPDLSSPTATMLRKMMAKRPRSRYQHPHEVSQSILKILSDEFSSSQLDLLTRLPSATGKSSKRILPTTLSDSRKPIPPQLTLALAGVILAGVLAIVIFSNRSTPPPPSPTPPPPLPSAPLIGINPESQDLTPQELQERNAQDLWKQYQAEIKNSRDHPQHSLEILDQIVKLHPGRWADQALQEKKSLLSQIKSDQALQPLTARTNTLIKQHQYAKAIHLLGSFQKQYPGTPASETASQRILEIRSFWNRSIDEWLEKARESESKGDLQNALSLYALLEIHGNAEGQSLGKANRLRIQTLRNTPKKNPLQKEPPKPSRGQPDPGPLYAKLVNALLEPVRSRKYNGALQFLQSIEADSNRTPEHPAASQLHQDLTSIQSVLEKASEALKNNAPPSRAFYIDGSRRILDSFRDNRLHWQRKSLPTPLSELPTRYLAELAETGGASPKSLGLFLIAEGVSEVGQEMLEKAQVPQAEKSWRIRDWCALRDRNHPRETEAAEIVRSLRKSIQKNSWKASRPPMRLIRTQYADTYTATREGAELWDLYLEMGAKLYPVKKFFSGSTTQTNQSVKIQYLFTKENHRQDWRSIGGKTWTPSPKGWHGKGKILLQRGHWKEVLVSARWEAHPNRGAASILFGWQDPENYYFFGPQYDNQKLNTSHFHYDENVDKSIPKPLKGRTTQKPFRGLFPSKSTRHIARVRTRPKEITTYIGQAIVNKINEPNPTEGKIGFTSTSFRILERVEIVGTLNSEWKIQKSKTLVLAEELMEEFGFSSGNYRSGFQATLYNSTTLDSMKEVRLDPRIEFNWNEDRPSPKLPADRFSIRWNGHLLIPKSGTYEFQTRSDDGVRLYLNNKRVIDHWDQHGPEKDSYRIHLEQGLVPIQLEYFEQGGGATISLQWKWAEQSEWIPVSWPYIFVLQPSKTRR
ncbi:MAG: protein kinase [Planctomycetota bacterium]|nr:protein kinase [Planctomycetota bacterium]